MLPTVLIVDDHADYRAAARGLLEAAGFDVIGEAADGMQAVAAAERLGPMIVLLDIQLPDVDGFAVAERLASSERPPIVVLLSSRDAVTYGDRIGASPARGFITKGRLTGAELAAIVG